MQLGRHRAFIRRLIKEVRWAGNAGMAVPQRGPCSFGMYYRLDIFQTYLNAGKH